MSQSPVDSANLGSLDRYQQGWRALNRLLHENKSFSGRETNNAFLNCGDGGRFADISTATGWDFADDARAIGLIDWDWDGDLDLWVSNRTAPRVRFLKNNLESDSSFVALHLSGDGKKTNRDGIGARVEVYLKDQKIPLMRTRQAGQSFLSQSSRWLHFGLGKSKDIQQVVVHWPGGGPEVFDGVSSNRFFHLVQGTGKATLHDLPAISGVDQEPIELPARTAIARIIPPTGHAVPPLKTQTGDYLEPDQISLITLWSRTCPHCQAELKSWTSEKQLWKDSEVEVILFATDQDSPEKNAAFLKEIGADFASVGASPEAVEILDALQASLVDLWLPVPVPSSFLVTGEGELLAVYRGPVSRDQVLEDAGLAKANPIQRRDAASPFPGRWVDGPLDSTPQRATRQLIQRNQLEAAIHYLSSALANPFVKGTELNQGDNFLMLGQLYGQAGQPDKALPPLEKAYALIPHDIRVLRLLFTGYRETGDYQKAKDILADALSRYPDNADLYQDGFGLENQFNKPAGALDYIRKAVELQPDNPGLRFLMIQSLLRNGEAAAAVENCKTILRTQPRYLAAANQLSRILSTHPDEKVRSPEEALALASRLCQITGNREGAHLVALALAQANLGKFEEATKVLTRVKNAIPADSVLGKEVIAALKFTTQNQPIRNPNWPISPEKKQ